MDPLTAVVLAVAALLTSCLSAIIGMGGGILLLAVMLSFMTHAEVIPTHAVVQLASNGTRALVFFKNVDRPTFARFALGALPGAALGTITYRYLGALESFEPYVKAIVGVYILVALGLSLRRRKKREGESAAGFPVIGFVAGLAGLTVGATGPLIAPFFALGGYVKERLIATKATCQILIHLLKIPAFVLILGDDFEFARLGGYGLIMIAMVIPGTLLGKRIVHRVSVEGFVFLYRVALLTSGLKILIFDGLLQIARTM